MDHWITKKLLVSGCSFSAQYPKNPDGFQLLTWPYHVRDTLGSNLTNLSWVGAGNSYIADSVINHISVNDINPFDTFVLVMWSGPARKDLTVSKDFYHNQVGGAYPFKTYIDGVYYVMGGDQLECMASNKDYKQVFKHLYQTQDIGVIADESLRHILRLKTFLEHRGFQYRFMSYVNYWEDTPNIVGRCDISLKYYASNSLLTQLGNNWIWADEHQNCLYEYVKERKLISYRPMGDDFHPTVQGHKQFALDIVIPQIRKYFI